MGSVKTSLCILTISSLLISCTNYQSGTASGSIEIKDSAKVPVPVTLSHLQSLFDSITNANYIESKMVELDFSKKYNGVYISNNLISANEPKHWIHINDMGKYSNVTFSTADLVSWKRVVNELTQQVKPKRFKSENSDIAERYSLEKYSVQTYEPANGINLELNSLYQILIKHPEK